MYNGIELTRNNGQEVESEMVRSINSEQPSHLDTHRCGLLLSLERLRLLAWLWSLQELSWTL